MWIERLHLSNYRCFEDFEIAFRPGFNVIAGVNGSGKTSLLMGLCQAACPITLSSALKKPGNTVLGLLSEEGQARLKMEVFNGRFRFEPQYPIAIMISASYADKKYNWSIEQQNAIARPSIHGQHFDATSDHQQTAGQPELLPIVVCYPANRQWRVPKNKRDNEAQAITERQSRFHGYVNWWNASADTNALQTWVISKCLERFQTSSETGLKFDDIDDDELALVNHALSAVLTEAKGLKYDLKQKSLLMEWRADSGDARSATPFDQLSDGQRAMIALVADIARRMCLLNPQLGAHVTAATPGVVLIDELDMHLHPHWQRLLTRGLKQAFPAVQFIVTSHSPQVLGELQAEEIILLQGAGTAHPQASYGLSSSQILQEIMGAEARTGQVQTALDQLFAALEHNQLEQARVCLQQLRADAPNIPELAGAAALLRRKEVLGR